MPNWVFECLSSWLNDCLSVWLTVYLTDCLSVWLTVCLTLFAAIAFLVWHCLAATALIIYLCVAAIALSVWLCWQQLHWLQLLWYRRQVIFIARQKSAHVCTWYARCCVASMKVRILLEAITFCDYRLMVQWSLVCDLTASCRVFIFICCALRCDGIEKHQSLSLNSHRCWTESLSVCLVDWMTVCLIDWWATCLHAWLTDWLTDDWWAASLTDWLSDRLMSHLPSWLTDWLTDWWAASLHDWLIDWLSVCLIDWLTVWSQVQQPCVCVYAHVWWWCRPNGGSNPSRGHNVLWLQVNGALIVWFAMLTYRFLSHRWWWWTTIGLLMSQVCHVYYVVYSVIELQMMHCHAV